MPMSCNFPMECRRWASTSSFWLVSFFSTPYGLPSHGTFDGTVGLTGRDVVHRLFVGMRVSSKSNYFLLSHVRLLTYFFIKNCGICYEGASSKRRFDSQQPELDGPLGLRPRGWLWQPTRPLRCTDIADTLQDREPEPRFNAPGGGGGGGRGGFGGGGGPSGMGGGYGGGYGGGGSGMGGNDRQLYVSNVGHVPVSCCYCSEAD